MAKSQMSRNSSSSSQSEFDSNCDAFSLENVIEGLLETRIGIVFQETPAVIEGLLKSLSDREVANCALVCKSWRIYAKKILDRREKRMCILFRVDCDGKRACTEFTAQSWGAGQDENLTIEVFARCNVENLFIRDVGRVVEQLDTRLTNRRMNRCSQPTILSAQVTWTFTCKPIYAWFT